MADYLPWLFVIGAALAVVAALMSLWLSLSLAFSDQLVGGARAQFTTDARRDLLTEKENLLQEIRDIAFEHDAGKLSDSDYEEINAKLRAQARHVLHELDIGAGPFRDEAEALIAERLSDEA
ncbi:MAG: hypothetical protein WBN14_11635 [Polyangiales bacterium]